MTALNPTYMAIWKMRTTHLPKKKKIYVIVKNLRELALKRNVKKAL